MISVIIPVYNVEAYLPACIESVTGQTCTDLQILLIDDGSTDRSGIICDAYAAKDSRIKVIHIEYRGVSAARNIGIAMAEGEWISFVDSDDVVHPEMLSRLLAAAERYRADLCMCAYIHIHSVEREKSFLESPAVRNGSVEIVHSRLYVQQVLNGEKDLVVWRSLYRREAVQKCRFDEGRFFEDIPYLVHIASYIQKTVSIKDLLYGYRQREGSITKVISPERLVQRMDAYELRNRYVQKFFPDMLALSKADMWTAMINYQIIAEEWDYSDREMFNEIYRVYKKRNRLTLKELKDRRIPIKRRLILMISFLSLPTACKLKKRLMR